MTRIGLVGCGRWGRLVLRDLRALGCEVVVVGRSAATRANALEGGAAAVVATASELPVVQGVVVVTPTTTHFAALRQVLALEVPVFVEKPLTADATQARTIVAEAGDRVFVMDKWRYHPGVEALARLARSGDLGRVVGLRTVRVGWTSQPRDVDSTWHLMPHDLAIALEVLGDLPQPRAAVAEPNGEAACAILGDEPWLTMQVSEIGSEYWREATLVGSEAWAVLEGGYAETLRIVRGGGRQPASEQRLALSAELPLYRELEAFVGHVRGGPPPRSSAADGLRIVETVAALRRLARLDR